jgi:hypothetical protein
MSKYVLIINMCINVLINPYKRRLVLALSTPTSFINAESHIIKVTCNLKTHSLRVY